MTTSKRLHRGDDGQMLLALLFILLITSAIVITVASVVGGNVKTRQARDFTAAQKAADTAVNEALYIANDQKLTATARADTVLPAYVCASTAPTYFPAIATGKDAAWCATQTVGTNLGDSWDLHVQARSNKITRKFVVTLVGTRAGGTTGVADGTDGHLRFQVSPDSMFSGGYFADQQVNLRGDTTVTSYNSTGGATDTGHGTVASNGTVSLDSTATRAVVEGVTLWDWNKDDGDRCVAPPPVTAPDKPTACENPKPQRKIMRLEVSDKTKPASAVSPNQFITTRCAALGNSGPWIASQRSNVLDLSGGSVCFSAMTFDNGTIPVTVNNPSGTNKVYVTGDISVETGSAINVNRTAVTPVADRLTIFSTGEHVTLNGANYGANTRVAWALWAPNADCGGSVGDIEVFGVMVCSRLTTQGGWALHYDDAIAAKTSLTDARTWQITRYEEQ